MTRSRSQPPNVLWLMTDEQRTDSLGCYGSAWARTPTIDRLAAEGVRFEVAVTPAPVCAPARSSILTGQYPNELGFWYNGAPLERQALPLTRLFELAGYRTASFGKHHSLVSEDPPFQTQVDLVLSDEVHYFGYAERWDQAEFDVVQYPAEPFAWVLAGRFPADPALTTEAQAVAGAKAWLSALPEARPFLLRLAFNGPHTPVVPPAPFDTCIDPDEIALAPREPELPADSPRWLHDLARFSSAARLGDEQIRRARQAYYGEVAYLDHLIGDLLAWLDERGLLENLLVVFCSDHGNHLGDFGLIQKQTFFDPAVNVPYVFWGPGIVSPRVPVETPVELRSLLPTLLDLAGVDHGEDVADVSLAPVLRDGADPDPRPVFSELTLGSFGIRLDDRLVLVRDGRWKLSVCLDPEPVDVVLFDLERDPAERENRADDPEVADVRERLLALALEHVVHGR
jgi:arylsulfatase A-like enzyme